MPGQNVVFRPDGRVQHVACPRVLCPVCTLPVAPDDPIRRDGEALVHGNCWMRRERETPEPDGITSAVRAKVMAGALPRTEATKVWAGLGKGLPCSGCGQVITGAEVENEVDLNGAPALRFHRNCLSIWQREVAR